MLQIYIDKLINTIMKYKFAYNTVVEIVNVTNIEIQVSYNNFILRWLLDICLSIKTGFDQ